MDNNNDNSSEKDETIAIIGIADENNANFSYAEANYKNDVQMADVTTSEKNTSFVYKASTSNDVIITNNDIKFEYKSPYGENYGGNSTDIENQMNLDDYNYTIPTDNKENLPQAVLIEFGDVFKAPVAVWERDRPEYVSSWGYRPPVEVDSNAVVEERKPVFSDEDKANPIKFFMKACGILLALPLYSIYYVLFKPFEYIPPICNFLDRTLFKAIGKLLDFVIYLSSYILYYVTLLVINPIYIVFVYFFRIMGYVFDRFIVPFVIKLCEILYMIIAFPLTMLYYSFEYLYNFLYENREIYLPAIRAVQRGLIIIGNGIKDGCILLVKGIAKLFEIWFYFLWTICHMLYLIITLTGVFIFDHILTPLYKGFIFVCECIYDYVLLPTYNNILVPFAKGFNYSGRKFLAIFAFFIYLITWLFTLFYTWVLIPFWLGIVWGFTKIAEFISWVSSMTYTYVLVPTYDYVIIPIYNAGTFVITSIFKACELIIEHIVYPLWNAITFAITSIVNFMTAVGNFIYENIILPVGRMISALVTAIANLIRSIVNSISSVFA